MFELSDVKAIAAHSTAMKFPPTKVEIDRRYWPGDFSDYYDALSEMTSLYESDGFDASVDGELLIISWEDK